MSVIREVQADGKDFLVGNMKIVRVDVRAREYAKANGQGREDESSEKEATTAELKEEDIEWNIGCEMPSPV